VTDELQRLLDEREILRRLVDYCRGVDRCDAALVASVYHPDGTDDHGSFKGLGRDFAEYVTHRLGERYVATMHTIGNPTIRFDGADVAHVETHVCARQRRADAAGTVLETFGGRYVDRFERRDGTWRIAHRTVVHEWDKVEHVELAFPPGRFTEGLRGSDDVSYRPQ
jgi:SnoaL-like domain